MPRMRLNDVQPVPIAGRARRSDLPPTPVPESGVLEDLSLGAEGGEEGEGRGVGGDIGPADRAADAFFRADALAQGLSLDQYKAKYGILIRAKDGTDENGERRPRWEGTTSDPFERNIGANSQARPLNDVEWGKILAGQRLPRIVSLRDAGFEDEE